MKYLLPTFLFFLFLPSLVFSSEEPCYVGIKTSKEFNSVLVSEISSYLISQYITEVKSIPPSGLSGEPSCIFEVSVTKDGEKTFVTLKGNNLNSFGDSLQDGTDGFQESILRSIYRSQRDKRDLICGDYGNILEECGEFSIIMVLFHRVPGIHSILPELFKIEFGYVGYFTNAKIHL